MIHLLSSLNIPMTTLKKRINISVSPDVEKMLETLSRRDNIPQATIASDLLSVALELEEDQVWALHAEKRDTKNAVFVAHDDVWK